MAGYQLVRTEKATGQVEYKPDALDAVSWLHVIGDRCALTPTETLLKLLAGEKLQTGHCEYVIIPNKDVLPCSSPESQS